MNRREMLIMAGVLGLAPGLAHAQGNDAAAARDAWLYALPLIEMATARARMLKMPGAAINALNHSRTLTDHTGRAVTTPNNDTLYSTAFLDLTKGPVTLTIPVTGTRYYSVAVMDMFTNNNVVLGTRTVGGEGGAFTLVGPGQAATGPNPTRIATAHAWLLIRTLVNDDADLAAAHKQLLGAMTALRHPRIAVADKKKLLEPARPPPRLMLTPGWPPRPRRPDRGGPNGRAGSTRPPPTTRSRPARSARAG